MVSFFFMMDQCISGCIYSASFTTNGVICQSKNYRVLGFLPKIYSFKSASYVVYTEEGLFPDLSGLNIAPNTLTVISYNGFTAAHLL